MAVQNLSPAPRTPAASRPYPKANPGYGKRTAPDQRPPRSDDFMLLPARERSIAGYVEHLPDGAAMDIKSLAKGLPLYGQMAVGTALKALGVAGHLRHVRCQAAYVGGQVRWVTLTFWSRTARDNEWWGAFFATDGPAGIAARSPADNPARSAVTGAATGPATGPAEFAAPETAPRPPSDAGPTAPTEPLAAAALPAVPRQRTPEPTPELTPQSAPELTPQPAPDGPSAAYIALARLGRTDPRLALSAADCTALEQLAAEWLARGADTEYLAHALTAGLPDRVDSPVGFVRRRLIDKIPPYVPADAPAPGSPGAPARRVLVECTECGTPGPPEALPDGLCRPCRQADRNTTRAPAAPPLPDVPGERDIHTYVGHLRDMLKLD